MPLTDPTDPIAAVIHPNPYPYYAKLTAYRTVYGKGDLGMWVAANAEDVTAVLTSPLCRVRPTNEPVPNALVGTALGNVFQHLIRMNDGEKHDPMKQAISVTLHTGLMNQMAAQSRRCADSLFNTLNLTSSHEQMMTFAFHLPVYVVASLLGVPDAQLAQTAQWVGGFVRGLAPNSTPTQREQGSTAARQLHAMLEPLMGNGQDSLSTSLQRESAHMGQASQEIVIANAIGLLMQSYDATAGLIANTLRLFATQPAIYAQVTANPCLLHAALQEVLRYDSPVQNTRRFVAEDGLIAGQAMKAGDTILVILAAANRDPLANPDPHRFDLCRPNRRLFTFGVGVHACPGEHMAISIAQAAIERFIAADLPLDQWSGPISYRPSANARIAQLDTSRIANNTHFYG